MPASKAERAVHRLIDMVVEEVSLVDRAANQRRFLIVKRSDPMAQDTTATAETTQTPQGTEPSPPETDETVADLNDLPDDEEEDEDTDTANQEDSPSPLVLAAQALEALTEATEILGSVSEEEARARVAELALELQSVATRLGDATNVSETLTPPPAEPSTELSAVIASVRDMLGRVRQMLEPPTQKPTAPETTKPEPPAPDGTSDTLGTKLDSVASELRAIGETVKEQQQRLARMEKRSGLPNSAPIGERLTRTDDDADIGWPLDLNRSLDRESVDKAISFHDV